MQRAMCSDGGPRVPLVSIQGDIFNAEALRVELGLPLGASISTVVQAAWQRWSFQSLTRLNGVFAVAVTVGPDLFLYRDASGVQGLYFSVSPGNDLSFATELMKLSHQNSQHCLRCARPSIHEYLRFLDVTAPNTILQDAHAVEPGQVVHRSSQEIKKWPVPAATPTGAAPTDFPAAVNGLEDKLESAVALRLACAKRPAAFLSGGIDSSLICAIASRRSQETTALTVGFDDTRFDEAPIAARIAAHLGMRHQILRFSRQDYLHAFERLSERMDQPMADPATMATVLAFDHCRENFDVVLDGMGADEAVGAMPPRHVRLAVGYASLLPRWARGGMVSAMRQLPGLARYTPILDFEHPADTMIRWRGFTRTEIEELCGEPVSFKHTQFYRTFERFPRQAHFERYSALTNAMPCDRLGQAALVTGFQARYPFFDRDVDAFIRQLRTDWRHLPWQPKRILRELLARYVPPGLWDGPKHGFNFPLHSFMSGDRFSLVHEHVLQGRWLKRGLLRPQVVQRYARQYIAGDQQLMFRVWALVVLGAWLDAHEDLT